MFSFLKGRIAYKKSDHFVLDVNGLGFRINSVLPLISRLPDSSQDVIIYTYMVVREDMVAMYGFPTQEELAVFEMLLGVSGVGPKLAGAISGTLEPSVFAVAVVSSDIALLSSVKGLGKKGAERIVVELKDKIKGASFENVSTRNLAGDNIFSSETGRSKYNEACSALVVLGYSANEANSAVTAVYNDEIGVEQIIKLALKELI